MSTQTETTTRRLTIAEALREGLREEMARDERVFCIGEDIGIPGGWGGAFTVTLGLEKDFRDRMIDTPISEAGLFGVALGTALMGLRPVADVQYGDFIFCAMDQVANQIAKMRYMSGCKITVPITMRAPVGATGRGAQHAQNLESVFLSVPGIKIVCPATAYDAKGLRKAAIRDDNPVLMFEHKLLYGSKGALRIRKRGCVQRDSRRGLHCADRQGHRAARGAGCYNHCDAAHDAPRPHRRRATCR